MRFLAAAQVHLAHALSASWHDAYHAMPCFILRAGTPYLSSSTFC